MIEPHQHEWDETGFGCGYQRADGEWREFNEVKCKLCGETQLERVQWEPQ